MVFAVGHSRAPCMHRAAAPSVCTPPSPLIIPMPLQFLPGGGGAGFVTLTFLFCTGPVVLYGLVGFLCFSMAMPFLAIPFVHCDANAFIASKVMHLLMCHVDRPVSCHITMNVDDGDGQYYLFLNIQRALLCLPRFRAPQSVVLTTGPSHGRLVHAPPAL